MNDKLKNLIVRTLSGVVMLGVLLGCVLGSPWSFGALLLAVLVGGMIEFYGLASRCGAEPQRIVGIAAGSALYVTGFAAFSGLTGVWPDAGTLLLFGALFLTAVLSRVLSANCSGAVGIRWPISALRWPACSTWRCR